MKTVGITAIGISTTSHKLALEELAKLRGVDPNKYTRGLECQEMSVCGPEENAATLATDAARRALEMWGGDPGEIGLLVVGTETAADMSRPLTGWVADALELEGRFRSYEVKHACFGGTAAVRQAVEWIASGAANGKVALVIAADVALYAPGDPGEPTQGAGAVAMIVSEDPAVAEIEIASYPYSMPVFDFWRPVGEAFPRVEGKFSLECYKKAARECFTSWTEQEGAGAIGDLSAVCFHAPFPKMVKKAFFDVAQEVGMTPEQTSEYYEERLSEHMNWTRKIGNTYTASVWMGLAHALSGRGDGERIGVFSYGSGAGAELMFARVAANNPLDQAWAEEFEARLAAREPLAAASYNTAREEGWGK